MVVAYAMEIELISIEVEEVASRVHQFASTTVWTK